MKLQGNKIIITGATRGIGKALLDKFYHLGNQIVAVARNEDSLAQLTTIYPDIFTIQADLSKQEAIEKLIQEIQSQHTDANTLINNAGIQVGFYDHNFGTGVPAFEKVQDEITVNFSAPIELCYRLIPLLIKNANAAIINVSSALAFVPKKSAPVYCGTKAGIHIFTKALRYQYEHENLKIFEIIPPLVATDMTEGRNEGALTPEQLVDEFLRAYKKNNYEVSIGKAKLLRRLQRIYPKIADKMLRNK